MIDSLHIFCSTSTKTPTPKSNLKYLPRHKNGNMACILRRIWQADHSSWFDAHNQAHGDGKYTKTFWKIESVNKADLFWYWQRPKNFFLGIKLFLFSR